MPSIESDSMLFSWEENIFPIISPYCSIFLYL